MKVLTNSCKNIKGQLLAYRDISKNGYFSRYEQFVAEFTISREELYTCKIKYEFVDGRSELSVQDEVLLVRVHDSLDV